MIDKDTICTAFESAVAGIIPAYLAEAETDSYPFLVYNYTATPILSKDGPIGLEAYLTASIVADDFDTAEADAGLVAAAVRQNMTEYGLVPQTISRDCIDGVWQIDLTWTVRQHTIPEDEDNNENNTQS